MMENPQKVQALVTTPPQWRPVPDYMPDGLTFVTVRVEITGRVEFGSLDLAYAVEHAVKGLLEDR